MCGHAPPLAVGHVLDIRVLGCTANALSSPGLILRHSAYVFTEPDVYNCVSIPSAKIIDPNLVSHSWQCNEYWVHLVYTKHVKLSVPEGHTHHICIVMTAARDNWSRTIQLREAKIGSDWNATMAPNLPDLIG